MRARARLAALAALALAGCAPDLARPPVALVALSPGAVPEGDAFATPVTLDGRASRDALGELEGPLAFEWQADDPTARFDGSARESVAVLRVAGQRVVTVTLTVRAEDGREARRTARLALTTR